MTGPARHFRPGRVGRTAQAVGADFDDGDDRPGGRWLLGRLSNNDKVANNPTTNPRPLYLTD